MYARDIFSRPVVTVRPDKPLTEAIALLTEGGFGALPVVDEQDRVIGIQQRNELERRGVVVSAARGSELANWLQEGRASAAGRLPVDLHLVDSATLAWTDRGAEPSGNTLNRATVQPTVGTPQILSTGYRQAIGLTAVSESEFHVSDLGGSIRHVDLNSGLDTELVHLDPGLTGIALANI